MDEQNTDVAGMIERLTQAVSMVASRVDELAERVDELDSVLYDGLIGPANEQIQQQEYDDALSDFRCKFGEKLEPFSALAKAEEGDDFDVVKKAFDTYNENEFDFSPAEYVDKLTEKFGERAMKVAEEASKLAEALGTEVTVETKTEDGETVEVKADEDGEVSVEGEKVETETEEEPATEEKEEEKVEVKEEPEEEEEDARSKWRKVAQSDEYKNLKI